MRGLALAVALAFLPLPSQASQYNLDQAHLLFTRIEAKRLRRAGVRTTLDVLIQGRTADARQRLAASSGLAVEKIGAWVALADLMRVRGIGPDVARLLTAAGVRTLADLQHADPASTATAVHELNRKTRLSTNPPGAESIAYWVAQARQLPIVVE